MKLNKNNGQRELKCRFKNNDEMQKSKLKHSSCLLTISVGQETHEESRFEATMKLIFQSFKYCTIAIHDTLQRFTIAINSTSSPENYKEYAVKLGDDWLERNIKYLKSFSDSITVMRWDDWLTHPQYEACKTRIMNELSINKHYNEIFQNSISSFLEKFLKRLSNPVNFNLLRARTLCFEYLVEECAVMCLWPTTGCQYEVYTSPHNAAMEATRNFFITPEYPHLVKPLTLCFNHRPNLKPQTFILKNGKVSIL